MAAILKADHIRSVSIGAYSLSIHEKIIPASARSSKNQASYCQKGDPVKANALLGNGTGKPKGICIHNTGDIVTSKETNPAEQYTRACWPNCNLRGVAVHFFVYRGEIWQNLAENEQGWHSGDGCRLRASHRPDETLNGNLDTIAIESIGDSAESTETTARLCAYLLKTHHLSPETDIYAHRDFDPNKYCPLYILPHWNDFCARVKEIYDSSPAAEVPKKEETAPLPAPVKGETVLFLGGNHFSSANATCSVGGVRSAGKALVTALAPGRAHPYHIVGEKGVSCRVYGWVDADSVKAISDAPESAPAAAEAPAEKTAPEEVPHAASYYPKCSYNGNSVADALKSVGVDGSYSHREKIALANHIPNYAGSAEQNIAMLKLLKNGLLIKE